MPSSRNAGVFGAVAPVLSCCESDVHLGQASKRETRCIAQVVMGPVP